MLSSISWIDENLDIKVNEIEHVKKEFFSLKNVLIIDVQFFANS